VSSSLVIYVTQQNKTSDTEEAPLSGNEQHSSGAEQDAGQCLPVSQSLKLQQLVSHKTM
jgi:hypothetical protein